MCKMEILYNNYEFLTFRFSNIFFRIIFRLHFYNLLEIIIFYSVTDKYLFLWTFYERILGM